MPGPLPLTVDAGRLLARQAAMARIGATPKGGVHRLALTEEDRQARRLLVDWARARGFAVERDAAGNQFFRRAGTDPAAPVVLSGSHTDTQPRGGRFDGIYGVLAAFEAIESLEDQGIRTLAPIEVVNWTAEEGGARFPVGTVGSSAYAGVRTIDEIRALTDADGISFGAELDRLDSDFADVPLRPLGGTPAAFVEIHIEQGTLLEDARIPVGVVTGIQGARRFLVEVTGTDAHAGTTPRERRRDAFQAAVGLVNRLNAICAEPPELRYTIGRFVVEPGAQSVIPGRVAFTIDLRHPDDGLLQQVGDAVMEVCSGAAGPCESRCRETSRLRPTPFSAEIIRASEAAAASCGLSSMRLLSGAAHDAIHLARLCPTGMLFAPSEDGISHNEAENTRDDDVVAGCRTLATLLLHLAGRA